MRDPADVMRGAQTVQARTATIARATSVGKAVAIFALGCAIAATISNALGT
jgi:hypothetical protein